MRVQLRQKLRPVFGFLLILATVGFVFGTNSGVANAEIDTWIDTNGTSVEVGGPELSEYWSNRLEFLSPVQIRDKVTGTIYATDSIIYDSGSTTFLRDGSGKYPDSNYLYVPMQSDYVTPNLIQSGRCFGIISWHLADKSEFSNLHLIQPEVTPDGQGCQVLQTDGQTSYTRVAVGARSDLADSMNTRIALLGAAGTPDEWSGDKPNVRMAVAPFYWRNANEIGAFDTSVTFGKAEGAALDGLQARWQGDLGGFVPPKNERQDMTQWSIWTARSTDSDCASLWLATRNQSPGYIYVMNGDNSVVIGEGSTGKCIWDRDLNSSSIKLINAEMPISIAMSQNSRLSEGEVDERMFGATGNRDDGLSADAPGADEAVQSATCGTEAKTALAWILCPVLDFADNTTESLSRAIQDFLFIDPDQFSTDSELYKSWNILRTIATVIIIIIALIMIFSEAMGGGIMDNYSVKKLLPRFLIAGIGVQLSWILMRGLIEVTNVFGNGIAGIIMAPFGLDLTSDLKDVIALSEAGSEIFNGPGGLADEAGTQVLLFGALVLAGKAAFGAIFALGIGALVAIFIGFVTLVVRNIVIYLGIVLSPLGIAMSVLPGTQKTSKLWWESFEKALILYPLIMALLAIGRVTAKLILDGGSGGFEVLAGIIAWYAPFFFIPAALKAGGSALGKISGLAGDKSKGFFDKAKNWDADRKKFRTGVKDQARFERAGGQGFRAGIARAGIRNKNGQPVTGWSPRSSRRDAIDKSMRTLQEKALDDATKEADLVLQKSEIYSDGGELLKLARTGKTASERQAAIDRLVTLKKDGEIRSLMDNPGMGGQELARATNKGNLAGAFSDKAPDIAKGIRDKNGRLGTFVDIDKTTGERVFTASAEKTAGWSSDTWRQSFEAHADGSRAAGQAIFNDQKKWDALTPEVQKLLSDNGVDTDPNRRVLSSSATNSPTTSVNSAAGNTTPTASSAPTSSSTPTPTPKSRITTATTDEMNNWIASVGGHSSLSKLELAQIANSGRGDSHVQDAKDEIARRKADGSW